MSEGKEQKLWKKINIQKKGLKRQTTLEGYFEDQNEEELEENYDENPPESKILPENSQQKNIQQLFDESERIASNESEYSQRQRKSDRLSRRDKKKQKSIQSILAQIGQAENEPMILSLHSNNAYKNDARFINLRKLVKQLKKEETFFKKDIARQQERIKQFIQQMIRDINFKMSCQQFQNNFRNMTLEYNQKQQQPLQGQIAQQGQKQGGKSSRDLIAYLENQVQRLQKQLASQIHRNKQFQERVTLLQQQNESLNETVFDYGQKIVQLGLGIDKNSSVNLTGQSYVQKIEELSKQRQIMDTKYNEMRRMTETANQFEENLRLREREIELREQNALEFSKELQDRTIELQNQLSKIRAKEIQITIQQTNLNKRIQELQTLKSQLEARRVPAISEASSRKNYHINNLPHRVQSNFRSQTNSSKQFIKNFSPTYQYVPFSKRSSDVSNRNRSGEKEILTIKTRNSLNSEMRLSQVGNKLQKLRNQIRKEINAIK